MAAPETADILGVAAFRRAGPASTMLTIPPQTTPDQPPLHLRIGEVGRRLGLTPDIIRAWERRYGVVSPARTAGRTRLYSPVDVERLRLMQSEIAAGMAPSEAARRALSVVGEDGWVAEERDGDELRSITCDLLQAVTDLDEPAAQHALDRLIATFSTEFVLRDTLLPLYFDAVQGRDPTAALSPLEQAFAVSILRGRLLGLARGWGDGAGPLALLACAPDEQRDLALMCFGIALRGHGWRVVYLGQDVAVAVVDEAARALDPDFVLVAASDPRPIMAAEGDLRKLARTAPLAVVCRGLRSGIAADIGARLVRHEPVKAAERVAAGRTP